MKTVFQIAIVGGSGSGKTWLAERLAATFVPAASRICLDDFYLKAGQCVVSILQSSHGALPADAVTLAPVREASHDRSLHAVDRGPRAE